VPSSVLASGMPASTAIGDAETGRARGIGSFGRRTFSVTVVVNKIGPDRHPARLDDAVDPPRMYLSAPWALVLDLCGLNLQTSEVHQGRMGASPPAAGIWTP